MSESIDRLNETMDRITANNEAYNLGLTSSIDNPENCEGMLMLFDAIPDNHAALAFWFRTGRKDAAKDIPSTTLDEVNARRGYA